jgi:glycosyltransferase involved in cell wall biosynthesis
MSLTEAMLFGLPIITASTMICPETAGDAALLVDPRSAESIAKAMLCLSRGEDLARDLGKRSRRRGEGFSW